MRGMRKIFIILTCLFVSACASEKDIFMGKPHMAVHQETTLNGRSMRTVQKFFGKPSAIRNEAPNQLWAYHQNKCTTLIYFNAENLVSYAESRGTCPRMKLAQTATETNRKEA